MIRLSHRLRYVGMLLRVMGHGYESFVPDPYDFVWLDGDGIVSAAFPDQPGVVVLMKANGAVLGPVPLSGSVRRAVDLGLPPFDQLDAAASVGYIALEDADECQALASDLRSAAGVRLAARPMPD